MFLHLGYNFFIYHLVPSVDLTQQRKLLITLPLSSILLHVGASPPNSPRRLDGDIQVYMVAMSITTSVNRTHIDGIRVTLSGSPGVPPPQNNTRNIKNIDIWLADESNAYRKRQWPGLDFTTGVMKIT